MKTECKYCLMLEKHQHSHHDQKITETRVSRVEYCRKYNYFNVYLAPGFYKRYVKIQETYKTRKGELEKIIKSVEINEDTKCKGYKLELKNLENTYSDQLKSLDKDISKHGEGQWEYNPNHDKDQLCINDTFVDYIRKRFIFRVKVNQYILQLQARAKTLDRFLHNKKRLELFHRETEQESKSLTSFKHDIECQNQFYSGEIY